MHAPSVNEIFLLLLKVDSSQKVTAHLKLRQYSQCSKNSEIKSVGGIFCNLFLKQN